MKSPILLFFMIFFLIFSDDAIAEEGASVPEDSYAYFGDIWRPTISKIIPGFDQYLTGNYTEALTYSGVGLGAKIWAICQ